MRAIMSAKLTPAAATPMRTSPAPVLGSARASTRRTSGPPCLVMTTTCTATQPNRPSARGACRPPARRRSEAHGATRLEPVRGDDLLDHLWGHRVASGQHHHRPAVVAVLLGAVAHRRRLDVDPV